MVVGMTAVLTEGILLGRRGAEGFMRTTSFTLHQVTIFLTKTQRSLLYVSDVYVRPWLTASCRLVITWEVSEWSEQTRPHRAAGSQAQGLSHAQSAP